MATNLIAFHNRESGRVSYLDDVVIVAGTPGAQPNPYAPYGFQVRQVNAPDGVQIDSLADADALLAGDGTTEGTGLYYNIDFLDTGGNGLFDLDNPFPLDTPDDDDDFALSVTAQLMIPEDGNYIFGVNSDDGSRLSIDGQTLILDDTLRGPHSIYGHMDLSAGLHDLELVYFERAGGAEVELFFYDGAGGLALLAVPEPATLVLFGLGAASLAAVRLRRRKQV
jgi:hypothetical protein